MLHMICQNLVTCSASLESWVLTLAIVILQSWKLSFRPAELVFYNDLSKDVSMVFHKDTS